MVGSRTDISGVPVGIAGMSVGYRLGIGGVLVALVGYWYGTGGIPDRYRWSTCRYRWNVGGVPVGYRIGGIVGVLVWYW